MLLRSTLVLLLFVVGCARPESSEKYLPNLWTASDGSKTLDLRSLENGLMGTYDIPVKFNSGEVCECRFSFDGVGWSGSFELSSCYFKSGGADPGCSQLSESGIFRNQNDTLLLCEGQNYKSCAYYY